MITHRELVDYAVKKLGSAESEVIPKDLESGEARQEAKTASFEERVGHSLCGTWMTKLIQG